MEIVRPPSPITCIDTSPVWQEVSYDAGGGDIATYRTTEHDTETVEIRDTFTEQTKPSTHAGLFSVAISSAMLEFIDTHHDIEQDFIDRRRSRFHFFSQEVELRFRLIGWRALTDKEWQDYNDLLVLGVTPVTRTKR